MDVKRQRGRQTGRPNTEFSVPLAEVGRYADCGKNVVFRRADCGYMELRRKGDGRTCAWFMHPAEVAELAEMYPKEMASRRLLVAV